LHPHHARLLLRWTLSLHSVILMAAMSCLKTYTIRLVHWPISVEVLDCPDFFKMH